jgi:hypothetical protein
MMMRVAVRGFLRRIQLFEIKADVDLPTIDEWIPKMAETHADIMGAGKIDMIEFEFLDDPGPDRFFRIGTNPRGMVMPMEINLEGS